MKITKLILILSMGCLFTSSVFADCDGCAGSSMSLQGVLLGAAGADSSAVVGGVATVAVQAANYRGETVFRIPDNGKVDPASLQNWSAKIGGGDHVFVDVVRNRELKIKDDQFWDGLEHNDRVAFFDDVYHVVVNEKEAPGLARQLAEDVQAHRGTIIKVDRVSAARVRAADAAGGAAWKWTKGAIAGSIFAGAILVGADQFEQHQRADLARATFAPRVETTAPEAETGAATEGPRPQE